MWSLNDTNISVPFQTINNLKPTRKYFKQLKKHFMKYISIQPTMRGLAFLFFLAFSFSCQKGNDMPTPTAPETSSSMKSDANSLNLTTIVLSQTRTANSWYNINTNQYSQWGTQYVAADDNSYAYTKKVLKVQRIYLILLDFGFTIPSNAVIENITATVKRFKSGRSQVKDRVVRLTAPHADPSFEGWRSYGVEMANPANLWPETETEVSYSQSGSGPNGIFNPETNTTMAYQWTPAMINHPSFGFYLLTDFPDKNFYYACFDHVQITVEYSLPETTARKSPVASEANPLIK